MAEDIAKLGLKIDSSGAIKATRELDKLERQSGETELATDGVTDSSKRSGAAMAAYAVAAAAATAAIVKSISLHKKFGTAISDLSAITGATGKDLQFYKEQALAIGESTTLSATQAAVAFKLIASAKPDLLESKEALAAVTFEAVKLAEAAGIDMPAAAEALGSALNQFSADSDQASRFINVLAAGSKFGASEVANVSLALAEAGTVAASANVSFEETNAAIQLLAGVAIKGGKAGTALKTILINLQTQADNRINPAIVGLSTALEELQRRELTTEQQAKLFGKEHLAAAQALVKNANALDTLTGKLTDTNTAYEQAAIKVDNLEGDQLRMNSAWESAALILGEQFDPALRGTTKFITEIAKVAKLTILEFSDLGNMLGAYAAIAVDVFTLDLKGIRSTIVARREAREEIDRQINAIWSEKGAVDALNESKRDGEEDPKDTPKATDDTLIASRADFYTADITALQDSLLTKEELRILDYDRQILLVEQWVSEDLSRREQGEELTRKIYRKFLAARVKDERAASSTIFKMRAGVVQNSINLLTSFGVKNKALALAQLAITKTLAISETLAHTQTAAVLAYSSQLIPGVPATYATAAAAYTSTQALGNTSAALIAAGGIAQGVGILSGGDSASTPTPTTFGGSIEPDAAPFIDDSRPQFPSDININISGVVTRESAEMIAESLRELFGDGGRQFV